MLTGKNKKVSKCVFPSQNVRVGLSAEATKIFCLHFTDLDGKLS